MTKKSRTEVSPEVGASCRKPQGKASAEKSAKKDAKSSKHGKKEK